MRTPAFVHGLQSGISIAIGYMPVALTFGLLAKASGLSLSETMMMSLFVFAGASQYIAINLIASGTGAVEIILTTFIVNIRHFLMSASLGEKTEEDPAWKKAIYAFGITDETFSVASLAPGKVTGSYLFGLMLISYSSWVINSGIGHFAGNLLPQKLQDGMSIALYAMFIGLLVPSLKKKKKVALLAGMAALCNMLLTFSNILAGGWAIIVSTLIAAIGAELIMPESKEEGEQ
ncbi:AzlC family ABC transporter permease [Metabacillus sp. GX 13764]|uniref:AzlC family ABC transporter permease n=1 Tax=Metabacillus kandeliae TaxID=2900151 RepID=UPI001E30E246|nr:AzlC family ABC transporter permease [Metabacillus kandeliae]MCD7034879.1 AzlC family ABC transporter permease [Metabacillus kandeliae]